MLPLTTQYARHNTE